MKRLGIVSLSTLLLAAGAYMTVMAAPAERVTVKADWEKVTDFSKADATLQVVVSPLLNRDASTHERVFGALQDLQCNYVRFVPWLPYPKLAVAELEPPEDGRTSWDFSLIDPLVEDFARATQGHSTIWNFSTIPEWMFRTDKRVPYPADPNHAVWDYEQGTELRDPGFKEVADYYARLVSWYTQGGFTDEFGKRHESGHHYKIDYWEVLNEADLEHHMSPQFYTALYDSVVAAIREVDPRIKFVGMALAAPSTEPGFLEYFLNPKNHMSGIPLDMVSYHFYAAPVPDQKLEEWPETLFAQAQGFLNVVRYIQAIRERLSPETQTAIDELGVIDPHDLQQGEPGYVPQPIPNAYWNLCGALYAYLYMELSRLGVHGVGESALAQLPTFFPSVTMVDWKTGQPNARYWVLKQIHNNFGPGDKLVNTAISSPYVYAQGLITHDGSRKLLLINKRNRSFDVSITGGHGAEVSYVDQMSGLQPPTVSYLNADRVTLRGFSVAVVTLPR